MTMNIFQKLTVILCVLLIVGCSKDQCGNEVKMEVISPDGKHIATLFERNCGATTRFDQVVTIRNNGSDFSGGDPENFIFTMVDRPRIKIEWNGATNLLISRPNIEKDIFKQLMFWDG